MLKLDSMGNQKNTSSKNDVGNADPHMTHVYDRDLVKIMSWYDNEWDNGSQMVREAKLILTRKAL